MGNDTLKKDLDALRIDRSVEDARRPRSWLWPVLSLSALALAAFAGWYGLGTKRAVEVRTFTVREEAGGDATGATVLDASGYVTARRRATVASMITGRLVEVRVEEGLPVSEGQVLARLDDAQHRAALELAESRLGASRATIRQVEARLKLARTTLGRTERLVLAGVVDQERLDQDETELESLEADLAVERQQVVVAEREVALRRAQLADTVIRAPFDGVVVSKDAQPGEMVSPTSAGGGFTRTGICTIVDMTSLEIEVDVNESYIRRVQPEQSVEAVLDAYPEWRIPGRVITTIPTADRQKATVLVRIAFDELDPRLLPDMGVKVAFREQRPQPGSENDVAPRILVPREAVRRDDGSDVVFVVIAERVERRAIRIGDALGDRLVVTAGLRAGEQLVVEGPPELADGDRVTVR